MWHRKSYQKILVWAAGLAACSNLSADLATGEAMPILTNYTLEGAIPDTAGKVVLLDVWASWCAPCKASFPELDKLQNELGPEGLCILGVSADRTADAYEKFVGRLKPAFPTLRDVDQKLIARLAPPSMPTTFIFGRDGRLRSVHRGFHGSKSVQVLRTEISSLLEESP